MIISFSFEKNFGIDLMVIYEFEKLSYLPQQESVDKIDRILVFARSSD